MKHKYRLTNGHQEWTGPTLKAAQAARDATLNQLFADFGDDVPTVIVASYKWMGIVFQRHDGSFSYRLMENEQPVAGTAGKWRESGIISTYDTRRETEFHCRRHLAQCIFFLDLGETEPVLNDGLSVIHPEDKEGREDHVRWARWQERYAHLQYDHPDWTPDQLHRAASAA